MAPTSAHKGSIFPSGSGRARIKETILVPEIEHWNVKPGQAQAFERAFEKAQMILSGMESYRSHQFHGCLDKLDRYLLLVNRETLEQHTEGFRNSDECLEYRSLLVDYYQPGEYGLAGHCREDFFIPAGEYRQGLTR